MTTDTHPDTDALKAYLLNSESPDYASLRMHLAVCPDCRNEADVLSSLINNHTWLGNLADDNETLSEEQHQLIFDHIGGRLQADESAKVKALINDNKYAMKSALHYSSHLAAMSDSLPTNSQTTEQPISGKTQKPGTSRVSQILSQFTQWFDFRAPVWITVPATAFTIALVVFSIQSFDSLPGSDKNSPYTVASYQDNPVIKFRPADTLPGIGFFSKADHSSKEYNGVLVSIINDSGSAAGRIKLQWPRIKNALQYSMRLQVFNQGQKDTLGEISTRAAIATFDIDEISHNKRYEWILTGKTSDEKTFYSTGGFVISKAE